VDTKSIWIQRIERRSLIARVVEIVNVMNKKSMLDRDNVELYIMSEEEEQMLVDFIMELDEINTDMSKEEQKELLVKMMKADEDAGLYDEEFPMKKWSRPNDMELQEWQNEILKKEIGDE
jgi:hypothetical protein